MSTTPDPPLPPPLEWHKEIVAVEAERVIAIKGVGSDLDTCRIAPQEVWLQAIQDHWKIAAHARTIQWLRDNTQPDPKIAQLRDQLRQLAGDAKTTDQQQAYAHACVLLDLALPKDYTPPPPTP
jgi:hypothetical protein